MMKKFTILAITISFLSACSMDDPETGERTSLGKAVDHAKAGAQEMGNAISETNEKWSEMNKGRFDDAERDGNNAIPTVQGDTSQIKATLDKARQKLADASKAAAEKVTAAVAENGEKPSN